MDPTIILMNSNADAQSISDALFPQALQTISGIIMGVIVLLFLIGLVAAFCKYNVKKEENIEKKNKSKDYRQVISDMYVAGKIRDIAREDKIDLDKEYQSFRKWEKKDRLIGSDIDEAVEVNLRDKVTEKVEKEIDNIK
jgi:hypothetical protein